MISILSSNLTGQVKQIDALTAEQEQVINKEIQNIMDQMIRGINNFNVDSVFKNIDQMNFSSFITNGVILDYGSAYAATKDFYSQVKKVDNVISEKSCKVLSNNSALFSCSFNEEIIDLKNDVHNFQGAMSCVIKKLDNKWKIIHIHQSFIPGYN
jgi:hypothetical protein